MNRIRKPKSVHIKKLIKKAEKEVVRLGYKSITIGRYRSAWAALLEFCESKEVLHYSPELGEEYLREQGGQLGSKPMRMRKTSIRFLHEVATLGACVHRRTSKSKLSLPLAIRCVLDGYYEHLRKERELSYAGSYRNCRELERFALFLSRRGRIDFSKTKAEDVYTYFASRATNSPITLKAPSSFLRTFFKYLAELSILDHSLIDEVPRFRHTREHKIPSIWPREAVEKLLAAPDRSTPMGKRDYAIMLIAARLGLRSVDIRRMKTSDIDWNGARIRLVQSKTGNALELPLTEEVGAAMIDYLRNGRPQGVYSEIFLRNLAPYEPLGKQNNLFNIIDKYRKKAGVTLPKTVRKGIHSLRHTLATRLMGEGISLENIASVLGHLSTDNTKIYAKASVEQLRQVAMEMEDL